MNKQKQTQSHKKSLFGWALVGILVILFIMFFINGYLIHKQTGISDQDISILNNN